MNKYTHICYNTNHFNPNWNHGGRYNSIIERRQRDKEYYKKLKEENPEKLNLKNQKAKERKEENKIKNEERLEYNEKRRIYWNKPENKERRKITSALYYDKYKDEINKRRKIKRQLDKMRKLKEENPEKLKEIKEKKRLEYNQKRKLYWDREENKVRKKIITATYYNKNRNEINKKKRIKRQLDKIKKLNIIS
jgi:hypothetical protein